MSIQVKNLKHIYNPNMPHESIALDDVSFEIEDEQFVGIIGHTGSGKSTLVQHLNGLLKPCEGTITVDGFDLTDEKTSMIDIRKRVGLVFQYPEYQLFEETIAKDIAFGPKNLGLDELEIDKRVREAMELVNLDYDTYAQKSPFELSGGQKRRVAIAGVIAMKPQVLILDEPTAGLDPKAHQDILDMIRDIHKKEKNITIFVSHNMNDVANLCDKIIVMDSSKCVLQGTPDEVFSQSRYLKKIGLDLPDATQLLYQLESEGIDVPKGIYDIDRTEKFVLDFIKGGKSND
jgi:energy-coupling factor transport system ATP-binding protein